MACHMLTSDQITAMFAHEGVGFRLARWERPIVPVVFGVDDRTLATVKGAVEAVVALAGHKMAETDAEQGANLMVFFLRNWSELADLPELDGLVPGISELAGKLEATGANQYRHFRFEVNGAIRAAFLFLCMDAALSRVPAEDLALAQAVQLVVLWGDAAFRSTSPLARIDAKGTVVLRPDIADLIRAVYDPAMPAASDDPAQALRLAARLGACT